VLKKSLDNYIPIKRITTARAKKKDK